MTEAPKYQFEPLEWQHLPFMRGLRNDGRINRWLVSPAMPLSEAAQVAWYEHTYLSGDTRIFVLGFDGKPVGYGQIKNVDHLHRSAEIGVVVKPEEQGKGYGRRLVQYLENLCFKKLCLHRAWLQVFSDNEKAIGLYDKYGFTQEGTLRQAAFKGGEFRDLIVMAILCTE